MMIQRIQDGIVGALVAWGLLFASHAFAATYVDSGNNKTIFFDEAGKRLTPLEANKLGESGKTVLSCKTQDYVCNERTGKCAMKNSR